MSILIIKFMKTKTINIYEYNELSEKAKEKALNAWREDFDSYALQVCLDNNIEELLAKHGIRVLRDLKGYESKYAKVYFSLSNCQGDGVMFEGVFSFPVSSEKVGGQWKRYEVKVKHSGRYYHSNSKDVEIVGDNEVEAGEEVYKEFEQVYQIICKELEKAGYEFIDDMQSEEAFEEACNANEYTFREDGTMENSD